MAANLKQYNEEFYKHQARASFNSANVVLDYLFSIIGKPKSILDIGCGAGTWLAAAQERGIEDIFGLDGSDSAGESLLISKSKFKAQDLSATFDLARSFDLMMSLEVAEHLPISCHKAYASSLANHGDLVLFSGAIPYQGGTGHISENWPQYWAALFAEQGFSCFDMLRTYLWDLRGVDFWYKQNILIFAKDEAAKNLEAKGFQATERVLALVHPEMYLWATTRPEPVSREDYHQDIQYYFELKDKPSQTMSHPRPYGEKYNNVF